MFLSQLFGESLVYGKAVRPHLPNRTLPHVLGHKVFNFLVFLLLVNTTLVSLHNSICFDSSLPFLLTNEHFLLFKTFPLYSILNHLLESTH